MFEHKDPTPPVKPNGSDDVEIKSEFWPGPRSNSSEPALPEFPSARQHLPVIGIGGNRTPKQKAKAKRKAKLAKLARRRNRNRK